jgi:tetratricopeptide (TPR) repeat protein
MICALLLLFWQTTLWQQAARAMREARFEDAERIYRQLLKSSPNDPKLRLNLGLALHSRGDYAAAVPELMFYLKSYPAPGPVHLVLGASLLKIHKPCEAIPVLQKARAWREDPQVLVELGDAYFGCRRYAEAASIFEALGDSPKALQGAGLSYARLGRTADAQRAFDRLASLPPSAELHELLAEVKSAQSRHQEALQSLEAALRLAPGDSRLHRLRARALWRAGRYTDAGSAYRELAPRWSHDPEFNYEYGDTLLRTEGLDRALPLLEKAVRAAPDLLPARGALGRALVQAGRYQEAIPHLEAASSLDATLLLPLSRAYRASGRLKDAQQAERQYKERMNAQN